MYIYIYIYDSKTLIGQFNRGSKGMAPRWSRKVLDYTLQQHRPDAGSESFDTAELYESLSFSQPASLMLFVLRGATPFGNVL